MPHPLLYEVNACQWLSDLSRKTGRSLTLATIPESELSFLSEFGFTHLWLMGVWPTGPRSRSEALNHPDLRREYANALPDWTEEDVKGSPYAIADYNVSEALGGNKALASFRKQLAKIGVKLILDFVPNHLGLDHKWVTSHPNRFVHQSHQFQDAFPAGSLFLAHGKDPYFPGWTDTVQIDYRRQETRNAMTELLLSVAEKCDGVRCDMAMLILSNVFRGTWNHVPLDCEPAPGEFWDAAIKKVKSVEPDFLFLAEAYWDLEGQLCELGFDYAYDKKLYDFVAHDHPWNIQPHLLGLGAQNRHRAHFLENHDEPRIAGSVDPAMHRAGLALIMGLPGMRFLHDGQFTGLRRFARVQLERRADEPLDHEIQSIYKTLLPIFAQSSVGKGEGILLPPRQAWENNPTFQCFTVVEWSLQGDPDRLDLVVINAAPHRSQCWVTLLNHSLSGSSWKLKDQFSEEEWVRDGDELRSRGLYLDVAPRGAQLFSFEKV